MLIDFPVTEETILPNFKGGEKEYAAKMFFDGKNRIMCGRLIPGASIGTHTHETSSEIIYILSGTASVVCDGKPETLTAEIELTGKFPRKKLFVVMIKYIAPIFILLILVSSVLDALGIMKI